MQLMHRFGREKPFGIEKVALVAAAHRFDNRMAI
jgi:hypothetical protein